MADNAFGHIFAWLGWAYIPNYATSFLQSLYYKLTIPVGQQPPRPGTPQFAKHYRRIRVIVLCLYLTYTLLQALYDIKLAGDFFTYLSVTPISTNREIKSRFRRLAAKYHPDKLQQQQPSASSSTPGTAGTTNADTKFLVLKLAQDTLLSPTLRFAYTRFGPGVTTVSLPDNKQPSIQTYVMSGIRHNLLPSYGMNLLSLVGLNYFFLPKSGSYWRYLILFTVFTVELYLLTHADRSPTTSYTSSPLSAAGDLSFTSYLTSHLLNPLLTLPQTLYTFLHRHTPLSALLPPHLLPYQILSVLRTLSISLNIFISQISPLLSPPKNPAPSSSSTSDAAGTAKILSDLNTTLSHLSSLATRTDAESTSLLQLQLAPYKRGSEGGGGGGDGGQSGTVLKERLRERMREGVVFGALKARPEVKEAIERVQARRRRTQGQGR